MTSTRNSLRVLDRCLVLTAAIQYRLTYDRNRTHCDESNDREGPATDWQQGTRVFPQKESVLLPPPMKGTNISRNSAKQEKESCDACLYTGVATCVGLSLYFAKIALLEVPDITKEMPKDIAAAHWRSKAGYLTVSAVWVGIGVYRWHLG